MLAVGLGVTIFSYLVMDGETNWYEGIQLLAVYAIIAVAMFFVGACSVTPQMFVPFAAHLAAPKSRGRALGVVMSGLLVGILVSRTASGFIGAAAGWRAQP